jgi:uncharacterized 2Fe-2S/4Fe-4S cluster protein (DUF4445 family)
MTEAEKPLTITLPELNRNLRADRGDNLLALLREAGVGLNADCGGVGRCGKCEVVIGGAAQLACLTHVVEDIEVRIPAHHADGNYSILLDYESLEHLPPDNHFPQTVTGSSEYAVAIDIGTTTVVGKLIERATGRELASFAQLNAQLPYGADVISRIETSSDDATLLSNLIGKQIDHALAAMLAEHNIAETQVQKLVIAANTAMSYILLNLPCRSLGSAPFEPAFAIEGPYAYRDVFHSDTLSCVCDVLPFISAYVGGDLTAGLCALRGEDDFILMDMGTNGELVFKRGERLICTATAAGPAFEGGAIECGLGSTDGAISSVRYENGLFRLKTIGAVAPKGICGSGILDLMAVLLRERFVDETGFLSDSFEDRRVVLFEGSENSTQGPVYFTQKDVRQYQLAKAAVRTGLEVLIREMGGPLPHRIFLAGGFGQNLDPESAIATGLLPEDFRGRVVSIGNSSLSGAVKVCLNESVRTDIVSHLPQRHEINLATHPLFSDLFMEHMSFRNS